MADSNFNVGIIFKATDQASAVIKSLGKSFATSQEKLKEFGKQARTVGTYLTGAVTLPLTLIGKQAIQQSNEIENRRLTMDLFTKDTGKTKAVLEAVNNLKFSLPIGEDELNDAALSILKLGVSFDRVGPAIEMFGKLSAVSGIALSEMVSMYAALQVRGFAGRRELVEFGKAGIPIMEVLMQKLGKSRVEITQLSRQGKISSGLVVTALKEMTQGGGPFADALKKKLGILDSQFIFTKNAANDSLEAIGNSFKDTFALSEKLLSINKTIRDLTKTFEDMSKKQPDLTKFVLALTVIATIAGPAIVAIGVLSAALGAITVSGVAVAGSVIALTAAIAGLVIYKKDLEEMWEIFKINPIAAFTGLNQRIKEAAPGKSSPFHSPEMIKAATGVSINFPYRNEKSISQVNVKLTLPEGVSARVVDKQVDRRTELKFYTESSLGWFFN